MQAVLGLEGLSPELGPNRKYAQKRGPRSPLFHGVGPAA